MTPELVSAAKGLMLAQAMKGVPVTPFEEAAAYLEPTLSRREEVNQLLARDGTVTPQALVEFAANPNTALHSLFEWDDTEAARKFRLVQAYGYLRVTVKMIPREGEDAIRVRAMVSLPSDRGTGAYRAIADVMNDPLQRAELLLAARRDWLGFKKRHEHLKELAGFFAVADEAIAKV